jgi:hypothetical protein
MISFRSFRKKINENSNFDSFLISEMAVPHHIRRTHHANIDEEDLDFLQQFPLDYWASARQQRYEKLWEMLKKLDNHRKENLKVKEIEEKIDSGLKKFVKTGDLPEELEKLFNEKIISYTKIIGQMQSKKKEMKHFLIEIYNWNQKELPVIMSKNKQSNY